MAIFPTEDWLVAMTEKLNTDEKYAQVARNWEGDMVFSIEGDGIRQDSTRYYLDLWHGKCRDAYLVKGEKEAKFVFKGPYSNWKKVIRKELDPIRGLIRGMFTVDGDSRVILDQAKAAQELVNTASTIPVVF